MNLLIKKIKRTGRQSQAVVATPVLLINWKVLSAMQRCSSYAGGTQSH
jgi:hypothetical protein